MTPLQGIAMGLVIVIVDPVFGGYDGVPDPVGWLIALWGVARLRPVLGDVTAVAALAVLCLAVSVATYPPELTARLDASAGWALSLPQLAFCVALATALAPLAGRLEGRLRAVRTGFVVLAVAPAVVIGGGLDALLVPLAVGAVAVNAFFVFVLFTASQQLGDEAKPR